MKYALLNNSEKDLELKKLPKGSFLYLFKEF